MNFIKSILVTILISATFTSFVKGQGAANAADGHLTGKVVDGANAEPVAFATVALVKKADSQVAKAIQTDIQGAFKMDGIPYGRYLLRVTFIGYATIIKDSLTINATHKTIAFGTLKMHAGKAALLSEVSVKAKKSTISLGIDRKVFSVEQSLVSEGGSATDLLTNVPSVQVDVDGNVSLRGSSNVRILIDGKPSLLAGGTVSDILQSIPASAIETIEVITNPSSKYDAEGESGIINIVLKKNKSLGYNGTVSASYGNLNTFNSNVSLSYQHKRINLYVNYSHRQGDRSGGGYSYRTKDVVVNPFPAQYNQTSDQTGANKGDQAKAGIDYNLTDQSTLSLSGDLNIRRNDRGQTSTTHGINTANTDITYNPVNNSSTNNGHNYDGNLDYSYRFKKPKEELTINTTYARGNENDVNNLNSNQYTYYYGTNILIDTRQYNTNTGNNRNLLIQSDYTDPLGKTGKLEAGYRSTLNRAENNFIADRYNFATDQFVYDPTISTDFVYDEKIHAVYTNYQQQFGKIGLQAGLRAEETIINTALVDFNVAHVQNYYKFYPSVFLSDKLTEDQTLQLSYTKRINRPRDREIIPFLDKSDPLSYRIGNPDLKPEDVNSFELSYVKYWASTTLTSSVYYRRTNNIVQFYHAAYDTTGITITRFANFTYGTAGGFEFIARTDVTPKLNVTTNLNLYQSYIQGNLSLGVPDNSGFAWNGNVTTNLTLPKGFSAQVRFDYQAAQVIAQGHMKPNTGVDGALKYDFYNHKASLSLNGRDIFNTRRFAYTTNDGVYYNNTQRRFQSRSVLLTFSYRFGSSGGKTKDKKEKDKNDPNVAPPDEGGGGGPGASGGTEGATQ